MKITTTECPMTHRMTLVVEQDKVKLESRFLSAEEATDLAAQLRECADQIAP